MYQRLSVFSKSRFQCENLIQSFVNFTYRSTVSLSSLTSNIHTIGEAIAHLLFNLKGNSTVASPEALVNELVSHYVYSVNVSF